MVKAHMRMKKFFILIGCCVMLSGCSNHTSEPMEVENSRDHDLVTVDDHTSGSVEEEDDRDFALAEVDDHVSGSVEAEEKWNDEAVTVNYFEGTFDTVEEFELIDLKPYVI